MQDYEKNLWEELLPKIYILLNEGKIKKTNSLKELSPKIEALLRKN